MRDKMPFMIVAGLILLGLAGLFLLRGGDSGRRVDASLIGISGLIAWTDAKGIAQRRSHPRLSPAISDLSIRVLPLYDTDLSRTAPRPKTVRALITQETQRDIHTEDLGTKLTEMPSLVILPKWTTGLIEIDVAHEITLIPLASQQRLLRQIGLRELRLRRRGPTFWTLRTEGRDLALFHAQGFAPGSLPNHCRPVLERDKLMLIIACRLRDHDHDTWIVADPDLMNNHGLSNAQNAEYAVDILRKLTVADTRPIYFDTSSDLLTSYERADSERRDYERTPSDLSRFFAFPFNVLWAMLFIVLGVAYWRGARRFGPVQRADRQGHEPSNTAAIAAKARLLRLSGNDGPLVADFVRAQILDLTQQTFGHDLGHAGQKRFFAHLARRDPALAIDFETTAQLLITQGGDMARADLYRHLTRYKSLLQKVVNAHGSLRISTNS